MSVHYEKGDVLYRQGRFDLAEKEFRQHLSIEPLDAAAHALLASSLCAQKRYDQAVKEANEAIRIEPESDFGHYVLSMIELDRQRIKEARTAIHEALGLDPYNPDYFAHAAVIAMAENRWNEALDLARSGLRVDADNIDCINALAQALLHTADSKDAESSLRRALHLDPDNSITHCNMGWILVRQGKSEEAVDHFKEALRLDPTCDFAQHGVVEALKADNPIFHRILMLNLWLIEMPNHVRIGVFATWLLLQFFVPGAQVFLVLLLFVLWGSQHTFNLLLRLDPLGRRVLSDQAKRENTRAIIAMTVIIALVLWAMARRLH